ncbi:MAG: DUF4386 family protein [Frankiaceae bacterium]|nr:DUF4386 family protein [Frankiaceae bacterium]
MTRNRWTGLTGVLFGISFFAAAFTAGTTPDMGESNATEKFATYWNDTSHQSKAAITALVMTYVFLLLIAFAAGLRDRLRAVDAGPLPSLVLAAGVAAAVLILAGAQVGSIIGLTADQSSGYKVGGELALTLDTLAYQLFAPGLMAAGVMAVCTSLVTLRTRVLPAWTAWIGFLVGLAAVGSVFSAWTNFFLLPVWALVIGLVLLMRGDAEPLDADAASVSGAA